MSDWFDPAIKAGGPVRSAVNFVNQMKNECEIFIFTSDRDLNDSKPMQGVISNCWIEYIPGVKVYYASTNNVSFGNVRKQIRSVDPHIVYLNSMFSKSFTVFPLWLKRSKEISAHIVLAPRGMLKNSALHFKKHKKQIFLSILRWLRIPQLVTFHATDQQERLDILNQFGKNTRVITIPNFPGYQGELSLPHAKRRGFLKILFIGRIHPIKGLDILLQALKPVKDHILLSIVGSHEDMAFLNSLKNMARVLPKNVEVTFQHEIPHESVKQWIKETHIFCLPTKGENFGHAIFEALSVGRPVLISDQTPWRDLQSHKAGWDIPLSNVEKFTEIIEQCALMDSEQLNEWCKGAWQFCKNYTESSNVKEEYLKLFCKDVYFRS
jgi:glycosyltransferase involved in cell wall biosynthesis